MVKSKFHFTTTGFLFLFLFLGMTSEIHAENRSMVAEVLCDNAQKFYDQGQKEEAIHEFSKVLLVDPVNRTAQEYLKKLGVPQGLYRPLQTFAIQHRAGEEAGQLSSVDEKGKDRDLLNDQRNTLAMKDQTIYDLKDTLSRTLQLKKDAIEAIEEKGKGSEEQGDLKQLIKQRDEDIAGLKEKLALAKKNSFSIPKNTNMEKPSPAATEDVSLELSDLKSQIRNIQLALTEEEMFLKEKDKALTEVKKQLEETTQRNNLSQKIIQEKDRQIKKLAEDLQGLQGQLKK